MNFNEFKNKHQKVEVIEYPNKVIESVPNPEISLRITTYQHKNFIKDAIEGVLKQKINVPYEIVIGDDESTDGTREICIEYAKKYPELIRLFLHKRENNIAIMGRPCLIFQYTYNIFQIRGKYIAGCSGDDYWTDPYKIQKQYDFLNQNPEYSACFHRFYILNEITNEKNELQNNIFFPNERIQRIKLGSTMMCRNIFDNLPEQFVEVLSEDAFVKFILATKGKFKYMKKINGAVYRNHDTSIWNSSTQLFRLNESINTKVKILETYRNTKFKRLAEKHLILSLYNRCFYINKTEKKGLFKISKDIIKQAKYYKLSFVVFPILIKYIIRNKYFQLKGKH